MLDGRVAIITGTNRGIGLATVKAFAREHAIIWACAREETEQFKNEIRQIARDTQSNIFPLFFDVNDSNAMKSAIKEVGKESKRIDILVNNAGISNETLFNMTTTDTISHTMNTNFISMVQLAQIASRYMIKQKSGSIINVASVTGIEGKQGGLAYGSSKAAIIYATRTMATELGKYGIRANSVSPGFIETDMWKNRNESVKEKMINETPLGRQGLPDEVAETILFLASDKSSFITSQNIVVDGGRMYG